jgi:hypothetical protein
VTDDEANEAFDPEQDNEAVFNAEVRPLMSKVLEICRARGIPFVALFQASAGAYFEHCSIPVAASWVLHSIEAFIEESRDLGAALT